jgi:hypothetical protein
MLKGGADVWAIKCRALISRHWKHGVPFCQLRHGLKARYIGCVSALSQPTLGTVLPQRLSTRSAGSAPSASSLAGCRMCATWQLRICGSMSSSNQWWRISDAGGNLASAGGQIKLRWSQ